jgi:hypothetical protein
MFEAEDGDMMDCFCVTVVTFLPELLIIAAIMMF